MTIRQRLVRLMLVVASILSMSGSTARVEVTEAGMEATSSFTWVAHDTPPVASVRVGGNVGVMVAYGDLTDIDKEYYKVLTTREYQKDFLPENIKILYQDYYEKSPNRFKAHATLYGNEEMSYVEVSTYGIWIREQMRRGYVLIGSGDYGYHDDLATELSEFTAKCYNYKDENDYLLDNTASPVYMYFADLGRYCRPEPIPLSYEDLNENQKRLYDITTVSARKIEKTFMMSIEEQSKMTPQEALDSGKYISIVSSKSPNDMGRRFLIYKETSSGQEFVGVVLVAGMAKRADWTGMDAPTNSGFRFNQFPLIIREKDGYHWGFDFPNKLYKYFGGKGGPALGIIAVDPDR